MLLVVLGVALTGPVDRPADGVRALHRDGAEVWHIDDGGEACDALYLERDDGWYTAMVCFETLAANMAEEPHEARRGRERLSRGTLADGAAAWVVRVDSRDATRDRQADRVTARWRESHVLVCAPDRGCAEEHWRCPARGCGAVTLDHGVLRGGGRRRALLDL